jgi:hypothetical protein
MRKQTQYPPAPEGVTRLRQTAVESFLKCSHRYFLEKAAFEQGVRRCTVRMAVGIGVLGRAPAPLADVVDKAVSVYDEETAEAGCEETAVEKAGGRDETAGCAREYSLRIDPQIMNVIAAEETCCASVSPELQLIGTPDYVTTSGVGDLKTGKSVWDQHDADTSRQLSAYAALHLGRYGALPGKTWIDSIGRKRNEWISATIYTARTMADVERFVLLLTRVAAAIKAGIETPAADGSWWCAPKWCAFYGKQCQFTR